MIITDLLDQLDIPWVGQGGSHHVTEGWIGIDCPSCSPRSGKFKLGTRLDSPNFFSCWTCGTKRPGDVLMELTGLPLGQVLNLYSRLGLLPAYTKEQRPRGKFTPPFGVEGLLGAHRRYLQNRGLDPDKLTRLWHIGGIGPLGSHSWRIYIPVERNGLAVSWTTRAIGKGRRYLAAEPHEESVPSHDVLYGADHARHGIVVHEGPVDVWAVGPGAVCTMGVGYSRAQLALMSAYPVRAIAFDSEEAAQARARKLCAELSGLPGQTYLVKLTGKDAATSPLKERRELRKRFIE